MSAAASSTCAALVPVSRAAPRTAAIVSVPARVPRAAAGARGTNSGAPRGGAGAVGTGSIRGRPRLLELAERFAIWPFDAPAQATVLEIYPRALYGPGPVVKSRWRSRRAALARWFSDHPPQLLERAAGSEDAFDAACSALRMSQCADQLRALPALGETLEGRIWTPTAS